MLIHFKNFLAHFQVKGTDPGGIAQSYGSHLQNHLYPVQIQALPNFFLKIFSLEKIIRCCGGLSIVKLIKVDQTHLALLSGKSGIISIYVTS